MNLNDYAAEVHQANQKWWRDIHTGEPLKRNVGELLMLTASELAEAAEGSPEYNLLLMEVVKSLSRAMEGHRKDLMDDKLPHRKMFEVELADTVIRILDICGGMGLDLHGAYSEKMLYNAQRADHKHENRLAENGKKY